jgi:esterase/lipase superfamily enzyme
VLFTWPSRASVFAYGYDRESTNLSRDGLEQVLNMLARDPAVSEVTILAHSMGNWLTLEVLRQMAIRDRRVPAKIRNVMLAAPDASPELVRLIGGRLERGQIIDDWHEGIGDRIVAGTTGAAASVGTVTGLAIAAPAAVIDPVTREHLSEDVGELETELQDAGSSVTDGQSAH